MLDRTNPASLKKPVEIKDPDATNKNITDLVPLPSYDPVEFPFMIKRGLKKISIVPISAIFFCGFDCNFVNFDVGLLFFFYCPVDSEIGI